MFKKLFVSSLVIISIAFVINIYFVDLTTHFIQHFNEPIKNSKVHLFSPEKLKKFDGTIDKRIYLSILGEVYDVTKGKKHYGPGESYHAFTGKDASRSFITGNFNEEDLTDDVLGLTGDELLSLKQWKEFYDKDYVKKGRLIGKYYDQYGNPTNYTKEIKRLIKEAESDKESKLEDKSNYPPCNIEWDAKSGTRVWCTNKSGGIQRDWIGYPVMLYELGSKSYRCACIKSYKDNARIKLYDDCELKTSCYVKTD